MRRTQRAGRRLWLASAAVCTSTFGLSGCAQTAREFTADLPRVSIGKWWNKEASPADEAGETPSPEAIAKSDAAAPAESREKATVPSAADGRRGIAAGSATLPDGGAPVSKDPFLQASQSRTLESAPVAPAGKDAQSAISRSDWEQIWNRPADTSAVKLDFEPGQDPAFARRTAQPPVDDPVGVARPFPASAPGAAAGAVSRSVRLREDVAAMPQIPESRLSPAATAQITTRREIWNHVEGLMAEARRQEERGNFVAARRAALEAERIARQSHLSFGPDAERPSQMLARIEQELSSEPSAGGGAKAPVKNASFSDSFRLMEWTSAHGAADDRSDIQTQSYSAPAATAEPQENLAAPDDPAAQRRWPEFTPIPGPALDGPSLSPGDDATDAHGAVHHVNRGVSFASLSGLAADDHAAATERGSVALWEAAPSPAAGEIARTVLAIPEPFPAVAASTVVAPVVADVRPLVVPSLQLAGTADKSVHSAESSSSDSSSRGWWAAGLGLCALLLGCWGFRTRPRALPGAGSSD